jgi:hypothetical protein
MTKEQRQQKFRDLADRAQKLNLLDGERLFGFILGYCERDCPPKLIEAMESGLAHVEKSPAFQP